jgi:nucleotide-binding universal stress UspA family protein
MKKILVPVDFSEVSKYAAEFAVDLAKRSNAEIIMLHSMHFNYFNDFPHATGINLQQMIEDVRDSVKNSMQTFIDNLKTNVEIKTKISGTQLLEAVKETIEEENIGLVVIGTKGSSGWAELLIGSNTERIVRWANCPVISVPSPASFATIKKILVPIDLREIQDGFMDQLLKLQQLFSAQLEFLWVKTPHNIENDESVKKEFNEILEKYGFKNSTFTIVKNVFPSDGILEEISDLNADLVAMATHSRRGLAHWLSGSLTEDTINHIEIPAWTFKLDKKAKNTRLESVANASGNAEYRNIDSATI